MNRSDPNEHCKTHNVEWEVQTVIYLYIFNVMMYILKNCEASHLKLYVLSANVYNVLERSSTNYSLKVLKQNFIIGY